MAIGSVVIEGLVLESGERIEQVEMCYEMTGPRDAPVVLICHALTGSHRAVGTQGEPGWWFDFVGPGKTIDTNHFRVIAFNVLGGCNGSTGPCSVNPETGKKYGSSFPRLTIRDMVHAEKKGLEALGVQGVYAIIGASLGGMRTLEWGLLYPNDMMLLVPIAVTPSLSDYGIGFHYIGIHAIETDPFFAEGNYTNPCHIKGFETAKMAGMLTYRSHALFNETFSREQLGGGQFSVESYLDDHGKISTECLDPNSYVTLLRAMNSHDIGRGRGGIQNAAKQYRAQVVAIGFTGDLLYPVEEIRRFIYSVPKGNFCTVNTKYGHDGYLTDVEKWSVILQTYLGASVWKKLKQPF